MLELVFFQAKDGIRYLVRSRGLGDVYKRQARLKPKHLRDGKTNKAYIWSYCPPSANPTKAVVFEFSETRAGENVREFLKLDTPQAWQGTLVTDGFSSYNATTTKGVTSAQCMAHARRKFNDLWANHRSEVGRLSLIHISEPTRPY